MRVGNTTITPVGFRCEGCGQIHDTRAGVNRHIAMSLRYNCDKHNQNTDWEPVYNKEQVKFLVNIIREKEMERRAV